ncbi:MAG: CHASE2 domain-containing protein, partial [Candidatus Omnitrophica bacterium]|nr:CHASE2 domain-containing protein [Candidatus Omnitrophota bacterium]
MSNSFLSSIASKLARDYILTSKWVLALVLTIVATTVYSGGVFDRLDHLALDLSFKIRGRQFTNPKIVIVEIAEDSIRKIGRWPWDRKWHATIVKALKDFGAKAIAFDILFSEEHDPTSDNLLAKVIEDAGNVYVPAAFNEMNGDRVARIVDSIPRLRDAARREGNISVQLDPDGILRRLRLRVMLDDKPFYQLGFLMALDEFGIPPEDVEFRKRSVFLPVPGNPDIQIPLTDEGEFLIDWPGLWTESFRHVSFIDVVYAYTQWLKGEDTRIPVSMFDGAFCIIGVSATGLFDIRATPVESAYPAVGVNAAVMNSVIEKKFLRPVGDRINIAILWILSAIIFLVMLRSNYLETMILVALLAAGVAAAALALFVIGGIVISVVYPLFLIFTSYLSMTAFHQIIISVEKNRLMRLATTDALTGLYNIAHFKRLLQAELSSAKIRT